MMRVFCDSVIFIYYFEGTPPFKARATARLQTLWTGGDVLTISDLVRLECRVLPVRLGDVLRLAEFDTLFADPTILRVAMTPGVFDRATTIRAKHNFKTSDSLHLAAAVEGGCDRFLTNDTRLSAFTDLTVEVLP